MYSSLKLAIDYCKYYLAASNGKGHGIHSPFVFDFVRSVLPYQREPVFRQIESCRKALKKNTSQLLIEDLGAGSATQRSSMRTVASIARTSLKPAKFASLFYRIIKYYKAENVIELGTSLGITTAYMASVPGVKVYTLEGAGQVAAIAEKNFHSLSQDISLIKGNFDDTLPPLLNELKKIDLAFIDGNHRKEATTRYFQLIKKHRHPGTIIILDDIHWSSEMENAWEQIKKDPEVTLTIDLFFVGIVFFREEFKVKQHFCIRF
jgi:predicted O-methyltransferase YrrM